MLGSKRSTGGMLLLDRNSQKAPGWGFFIEKSAICFFLCIFFLNISRQA
jgi:hypothetical protein